MGWSNPSFLLPSSLPVEGHPPLTSPSWRGCEQYTQDLWEKSQMQTMKRGHNVHSEFSHGPKDVHMLTPETVNQDTFRGRGFENYITIWIIFKGLKFNDECPSKRQEKTRKGERLGRAKQRLELNSHKPRSAGAYRNGRSREDSPRPLPTHPHQGFQQECSPAHTLVWPSGSQNSMSALSHQICANFHRGPRKLTVCSNSQ